MKPLKANYTKIVMQVARKVPCFFPSWLRTMAKEYSKEDEIIQEHLNRKKVLTSSLLRGDFKWKGVSVVTRIDNEELEKIHKWFRLNPSTGHYSDFDTDWFQTRFDRVGGFRSIGWIGLKSHSSIHSVANLDLPNNCCESCYATITKVSHGIAYITLYFMLSEEATRKVLNVDVSGVEGYYCFQTFNFFSKRLKGIEHHDQHDAASSVLIKNIDSVYCDVKAASSRILKWWGIKKTDNDLVFVADIYRDTNDPYFEKKRSSEADQVDTEHVLIDRSHTFFDDKLSDDASESYCHQQLKAEIAFDALFIKSKRAEGFEPWENFPLQASAIHDSHLFFSLFWEVSKKYDLISNYASTALLINNKSIEVNHKILFNSKIRLHSLKNNIEGINILIDSYCSAVYSIHAKRIANNQLQYIEKLITSVEDRILTLDKQIQLLNLKFNRRYAWIVGLLVIVQIALAVLTGDWSKSAGYVKKISEKFHYIFVDK